MPEKSVSTPSITERRSLERRIQESEKNNVKTYKSFEGFISRSKRLKLNGWSIEESNQFSTFRYFDDKYTISKFELVVDHTLEFTLRCFGWLLPDDHTIYKETKRSLRYTTLSMLLNSITS